MKTITGTFRNADNSAIANGVLRLRLSQVANVSGTALFAPTEVVINLNSSGAIPAATQIWANDEITPTGTTYLLTVYSGSLINGAQTIGGQIFSVNVSITGTSPIDLTTLTPTSQGVSLVVPISSVSLTMPAEFSVAGSPVTASGGFTVTKANESANQVWAGPTTGAPAAPAFRALVDADIPVTLTNHTLATPTITSPTTTGTDAGAETLKNKTLNGAGNGNAVNLLNQQPAAAAIVGNSTDLTLFSFAIPANTIGAGKGFRVRFSMIHSTGTASVTYKLILGTTTLNSWSDAGTAAIVGQSEVFNAAGVQNSQYGVITAADGATVTNTNFLSASSENLANADTLKLTFNVAATDQVTPKFFLVELIQ